MKNGAIAISVYYAGDDEGDTPFNTGWIRFTLNSNVTRDFKMPNVPNTAWSMNIRWSARWMDSLICYSDPNFFPVAFPQFTWEMDEKIHEVRYHGPLGLLIAQYSGKWEKDVCSCGNFGCTGRPYYSSYYPNG